MVELKLCLYSQRRIQSAGGDLKFRTRNPHIGLHSQFPSFPSFHVEMAGVGRLPRCKRIRNAGS